MILRMAGRRDSRASVIQIWRLFQPLTPSAHSVMRAVEEAGAGDGLQFVDDLRGREDVHDAAFSLASRRARTLTTPSMMASGRGGQPGTYMSTGMIWSTGPMRL